MSTAMTVELWTLVGAVVLTFVQMLAAVTLANSQVGLSTLAGNREGMGEMPGLAGRARRAHRNMLESLPLFAVLVLVAHVAGVSNVWTVLGAHLFLWSRLVYAVVYLAGIPWLRTLVWFISVIGMAIIAVQLF